jgi:hypothetical protein
MSLLDDWDGIAQEKTRSWDREVRQRQLLVQIPRQRPHWRRKTGSWLMHVGGRLTRWGAEMAECDGQQEMPVAG